ncbi:hypothetical protein ASE05_27140 [Mesorhizobium sp. Root172]|uniref:ATP-grasp domain-containing protein n=2 Tax=Phyllobacteriaceae TaxID=69277 RepID=A0AA91F3F8_RHILI|nr:hypothetical protein ASE05_27140 [Mesorhizobium sp. Root172]OBQ60759.1 hypothetical protein A8145_22755 [Mesorhizobium loti]
MILILADAFDSHVDAVEIYLRQSGSEFSRLNLDVESLRQTSISFDGDIWVFSQNGIETSSADISCVWARRLTVSLTLEQQNLKEDVTSKIWRAEWNRCLYGLYAHLRDIFWMNPIAAASLADNKYFQFQVAKSQGFLLPPILSSNSKIDLLKFAERSESVAVKFMSQDIYMMPNGEFKGVYVNKIDKDDLSEFGGHDENPITLQKYIRKSYEVRHTYVDGSHFSCKIESQLSSRASIDWRRYDVPNTPHSAIASPPEVIRRINSIMSKLGLYYGAFDFIVDDDDRWWYLEVNSSGQWLWIEDLVGLPISARVAESLAQRSIVRN